jgi:hypothetical protein
VSGCSAIACSFSSLIAATLRGWPLAPVGETFSRAAPDRLLALEALGGRRLGDAAADAAALELGLRAAVRAARRRGRPRAWRRLTRRA